MRSAFFITFSLGHNSRLVFCSGSHKAVIKTLAGVSLGAQVLFCARVCVGRIHGIEAVELTVACFFETGRKSLL